MVKVKDESTESRILMAAKNVFLAKGMDGARMQDIADEAGINKAMLHYYFRSKEKLFETIFSEIAKEFLPKIAKTLAADVFLFQKIEVLCCEYIDQIAKTPYMPIFVLNEINKQPEGFVKKMWNTELAPVGYFMEQVNREVKKGTIRSIDPAQLLLNIVSLCIFPFAAKPLFQVVTGMSQKQLAAFMEQRKTEVSRFIIQSIKK